MRPSNRPAAGKSRWQTLATPALIALVLLLLYAPVLRRSHNASIDAKIFYLAGKAFVVGGNPYDPATEQALVARYAPDDRLAEPLTYLLTHPPITSLLFALPALLPWPAFWALMLAVNIASIPLAAFLLLRFWGDPSPRLLWPASFFIAFLPPTWQCLRLGQIALPMLVCSLLAAHFFYRERFRGGGLSALLAMVKPTLCLPLLAFLFLRGGFRARRALLLTGLAYAALNLAGVWRLQAQGIDFKESYQRALDLSFAGGGINDPLTTAIIRLDLEALLASTGLGAFPLIKPVAVVLLAGLFGWAMRPRLGRESSFLFGGGVIAMLLLSLTAFYHRSYDGVVLAAAFFYALAAWKSAWRGEAVKNSPARWCSPVLGAVILLGLAAIGAQQHNLLNLALRPLGMEQPVWFKAAGVLVAYGFLTMILRRHAQGEFAQGEKA